MCGIVGIFNYGDREPVDHNLLKKMTDLLFHRGPDGEGYYFDDENGIGLGHRRLAIIDLKMGNQPMTDETETIWIVYNGEIYNYKELRQVLKNKGYAFRTNSDTEVLLAGYKDEGVNFLNRLNGIFSFAIWDKGKKEFLIARDHLGVKPVYYLDTGKNFLCASEIKSLLRYPDYKKEIDLEGVDLFFTFRHTPSPKTLFKNISKLPPGSYLRINHLGIREKKCYWDFAPPIMREKRMEEWLPLLDEGIKSAVKRQMVSDVPISLSLSGGTDSNLLLAIMSKYSNEPVNCFTIGFKDNQKYDEVELAKISCRYYGGCFKFMVLGFEEYRGMFDKYIWHLEEPLGNESALAYYFVAKLAHENGIKVLLNGQGADELFGGYHRYIGERYRFIMNSFPQSITRYCSSFIKNERLRRSLYTLNIKDEVDRFFLVYSIFLPEEKNKLYNHQLKREVDFNNGKNYIKPFFGRFSNHNPLEKMFYIDLRFSLPDDLLLAEDKMAMATSVEARVPYLDIEYLKIAEAIPAEYKIRNFQFKYIYKRCLKNHLPQEFIKRKKIGFTNPMRNWLSREMENYYWALIMDKHSFTNDFLNLNYIKKIFLLHKKGLKDYKRNLFLILSLEQWFKKFFH